MITRGKEGSFKVFLRTTVRETQEISYKIIGEMRNFFYGKRVGNPPTFLVGM